MLKHKTGLFALAAVSLALAACGSSAGSSGGGSDDGTSTTGGDASVEAPAPAPKDGPEIVIGAQDFGESAILSEVYGQALQNAGYTVKQQALGGYRDVVYTSFDSGDINFTADYAASAAEFLKPETASSDIDATLQALRTELEPKKLEALEASPAVDSNSFVVTAETAAKLKAPMISALTPDLRLGGPADCPDNASCIPGLKEIYGIDMSAKFTPLDGGGPVTKKALEAGEVDVAVLFSTDSTIAEKGWVVLDDDKGLINADNVVPVMSTALTDAYGAELATLINKVSGALSTAELTEMNRQYDIDKLDASDVAAQWLQSEGILAGSTPRGTAGSEPASSELTESESTATTAG